MHTPDLSTTKRRESLAPSVDIDELFVQLVEALDRDLDLVEVLRYRLTVLGALAGTDQGPSIPMAVRELGIANEELRVADLVRAATSARIAEELGMDPESSSEVLVSQASDGWKEVLLERRRSLIEAITRVQGLSNTVSTAMRLRAKLSEEALAFLRGGQFTSNYGRETRREAVLVEGSI